MAYFEWTDKLSVGVYRIDYQHKKLVALLEELHSAMKQRNTYQVLEALFDDLEAYTQYHFRTEEKLMEQHECYALGCDKHLTEHHTLIAQLADLRKSFDQGNPTVGFDLMAVLKDWLFNHIMMTDQRLGVELNRRGVT